MNMIFQTDYIAVEHDQEKDCLIMIWLTSPTSEEYRIGVRHTYDIYKNLETKSMLVDCRDLGIVSLEDQEWSANEWFKIKNPSFVLKSAILISKDIISKMAIDEIKDNVDAKNIGMNIRYFSDELEARSWLSMP